MDIMVEKIIFGTAKSHIIYSMYRMKHLFEDGFSFEDLLCVTREAYSGHLGIPEDGVNFAAAFKELISSGIIASSPYFPDTGLDDPLYRYTVTPRSFEIEGGLYQLWMRSIFNMAQNKDKSFFTVRDAAEAIEEKDMPFPEKGSFVSAFLLMLSDQGYLSIEREKFLSEFHPSHFRKFSIESIRFYYTPTKKLAVASRK